MKGNCKGLDTKKNTKVVVSYFSFPTSRTRDPWVSPVDRCPVYMCLGYCVFDIMPATFSSCLGFLLLSSGEEMDDEAGGERILVLARHRAAQRTDHVGVGPLRSVYDGHQTGHEQCAQETCSHDLKNNHVWRTNTVITPQSELTQYRSPRGSAEEQASNG